MSDGHGPDAAADAAQPEAPASPFIVDIQMRFRDTDRLGHVNNATLATYAEVGRLEYLKAAGAGMASLILARLAIDFRAQVHMGQRVRVSTEAVRIGSSSITLRQAITADEVLAADIESVVVCFDYETQRPVPVPEALRRIIFPPPR